MTTHSEGPTLNATRALAQQFATALDQENYAALAQLLAPDCHYETAGGLLIGPEAIVASYREASTWGKAHLDAFTYESVIRVVSGGCAVVTFIDHLEHQGRKHSYSCEQSIALRADDKICRITHQELPGQRDVLEDFFRQAGLERSGG